MYCWTSIKLAELRYRNRKKAAGELIYVYSGAEKENMFLSSASLNRHQLLTVMLVISELLRSMLRCLGKMHSEAREKDIFCFQDLFWIFEKVADLRYMSKNKAASEAEKSGHVGGHPDI